MPKRVLIAHTHLHQTQNENRGQEPEHPDHDDRNDSHNTPHTQHLSKSHIPQHFR
jgi:hypothetical protein